MYYVVFPLDDILSDPECTIVGLLQFKQTCPLQILVLGHLNCVSKEKETRKCNFTLCKIFLNNILV